MYKVVLNYRKALIYQTNIDYTPVLHTINWKL